MPVPFVCSVSVPGNLPQGFPLELLAKLCTCLIYLGFSEQAKVSELSAKAAGGLDLCVCVFLGTGSDTVIPVVGMNEPELLARLCTCLIYLGFSEQAKVS